MTQNEHVELSGPATAPFIFTAPHDRAHHRLTDGVLQRKMSEPGTGALARFLAEEFDGLSAVNISDVGDANWDAQHPLKELLDERGCVTTGAYLIDLHGMTDQHGIDIAIGPGRYPERSHSLVEPMRSSLAGAGFTVLVDMDGRFAARGEHRVTSWAQLRGADAIQVEISASLRRLALDHTRQRDLQEAFVTALRGLTV